MRWYEKGKKKQIKKVKEGNGKEGKDEWGVKEQRSLRTGKH